MKPMNKHILLLLLLVGVMGSKAKTLDITLPEQARLLSGELLSLPRLEWNNPALKHWQSPFSMSEVGLSWQLRHEDEPIATQMGNHETTWAFDATTYMHQGNATLWGRAFYNNGRQRGIHWSETSDVEVVYPYLLADSVDTHDMNLERYSFMGGYAHVGKHITWGASIGYKAGLYYRQVDPRPRNVTADLDIAAGIGYISNHYVMATAVEFKNYKQTNNVTFYSEMGSDKLFHLTGLANDYGRFAGTGYSTYYKGQRWAMSFNLHHLQPRGPSVTVQASRLAFDNVLTSINKLPMAHVTHNALMAQATWNDEAWLVRAFAHATRRVGTENIFGDPAAQVYQKIGQLDMYHENRLEVTLDGIYEYRWERAFCALHPSISYHHLNTIYADPQGRLALNELATNINVKGGTRLGKTFTALTLGMRWNHPVEHELLLTGTKSELMGLQRAIEHDFNYLATNHMLWRIALIVDVPVSNRYVIRTTVDWKHQRYSGRNHTHQLFTALSFIF